jgi:hypothetical protein
MRTNGAHILQVAIEIIEKIPNESIRRVTAANVAEICAQGKGRFRGEIDEVARDQLVSSNVFQNIDHPGGVYAPQSEEIRQALAMCVVGNDGNLVPN